MPTLGHDGIGELLPTNQASEGDLLLVVGNVVSSESLGFHRFGVLFVHLPAGEVVSSLHRTNRNEDRGRSVRAREKETREERKEGRREERKTHVVKEFASISETTPSGFCSAKRRSKSARADEEANEAGVHTFIVLTHIGLVVDNGDGSNVARRLDRTSLELC